MQKYPVELQSVERTLRSLRVHSSNSYNNNNQNRAWPDYKPSNTHVYENM